MIEVNAVWRKNRKVYFLRWLDPITGARRERSAGTSNKRAAVKAAGELQAELQAGGVVHSSVDWSVFRADFEQHLDSLSDAYFKNFNATFNAIEKYQRTDRLNRINAAWLTRFRATMAKQGRSRATIHKYFQHIHTALCWAVDQGYLNRVPVFPKQKRNSSRKRKHMKGRPVTTEEFERMLKHCQYDSIEHLIRGIWLSGLRIGEALSLTWDQWADGIRVQEDSGELYLAIDADDQKNGEVQIYPITDEFAEFLRAEPDKTGHVFNPCRSRKTVSRRVDTVSDWLIQVGAAAGVKVDEKDGKPVWASAHDLRRGFGARWAMAVPPMVLRDLMRHRSVATTEVYYVGINAKRTLEAMREHTQSPKAIQEGKR